MNVENRKGMEPVPANAESMLNTGQRQALHQMENFGWRLYFIRRPLFANILVVIVNGEGNKVGVLEEDGRINMEPDIKLRAAARNLCRAVRTS